MFTASEAFVLFDYFRVPYERAKIGGLGSAPAGLGDAFGWLQPTGDSKPVLRWPSSPAAKTECVLGAFTMDSVPIFGRLLPDERAKEWLSQLAGTWRRSTPIYDLRGTWVASVWTESRGSTLLPFDPNEVIERYWSESYAELVTSPLKRRTQSAARAAYYRARPLTSRAARITARRLFSRWQSRARFPRWPVEPALHDFYRMLFAILSELAGKPIPMISLWPEDHGWALVLTHDVETRAGYDNIDLLCDIELGAGYRSSWNFVPSNHHVLDESVIEKLVSNGFEVGVHGLRHDGRDIAELDARLPAIREHADRWGAVGFRSPATLRNWEAMSRLGFDYDSTYFDTSPYEPQPGGSCTWLPYMIEDLVELPITLPQDHTLFEILGALDADMWLEKVRFLKAQNGMALVLTHPDYARNGHLITAYRMLLDEFADDATAWKALPRDVSRWWRSRAASKLVPESGSWKVVGPAADVGIVEFSIAGG